VTPSVPAIPEQSCEDERPVTAVRDGGQGEKTAGEGKKRGMLGLRGKSKLFLFLCLLGVCQLQGCLFLALVLGEGLESECGLDGARSKYIEGVGHDACLDSTSHVELPSRHQTW